MNIYSYLDSICADCSMIFKCYVDAFKRLCVYNGQVHTKNFKNGSGCCLCATQHEV